MAELTDTAMKSSSPIPSFMETILQSYWYILIKATPPVPDTSPGSAEILITYRGGKSHSSKKANTDLLINYLQGVLPKLQKWMKRVGVSGREALERGSGAQLTPRG